MTPVAVPAPDAEATFRRSVANRLQAAPWQEAFNAVRAGVASVADVDAAIVHGPGLRWALLGPFLTWRRADRPGRAGWLPV